MFILHNLRFLLLTLICISCIPYGEAKIKECSDLNIKVQNDSLHILINKISGKAFNTPQGYGMPYIHIEIFPPNCSNDLTSTNSWTQIYSERIYLKPKQTYELHNTLIKFHIDELKKYCYDEENHIFKKRSYWISGQEIKVPLSIMIEEFAPGNTEDRKYFSKTITIPCKDTEMSIGDISANVTNGNVDIILSDVNIINPEGGDFQINAYFYDSDLNPLKDLNNNFSTTNGHVALTCRSYNELWNDLRSSEIKISMPKEELHINKPELLHVIGEIHNMSSKENISTSHYPFYVNFPRAEIGKIWAAGDDFHTHFHISTLKIHDAYGKKLQLDLHIYDKNKSPIKDRNSKYYTLDGKVGTSKELNKINNDTYAEKDFIISIPTEELHINRDIDNNLFCKLFVIDTETENIIASSIFEPFEILKKIKPTLESSRKITDDNMPRPISNQSKSTKQNRTETTTKSQTTQHQHEPQQVWKERWKPCISCDPDRKGRCSQCHGKGGYYIGNIYNVCTSCSGTGACVWCGGRGEIMETYSVWE